MFWPKVQVYMVYKSTETKYILQKKYSIFFPVIKMQMKRYSVSIIAFYCTVMIGGVAINLNDRHTKTSEMHH